MIYNGQLCGSCCLLRPLSHKPVWSQYTGLSRLPGCSFSFGYGVSREKEWGGGGGGGVIMETTVHFIELVLAVATHMCDPNSVTQLLSLMTLLSLDDDAPLGPGPCPPSEGAT